MREERGAGAGAGELDFRWLGGIGGFVFECDDGGEGRGKLEV